MNLLHINKCGISATQRPIHYSPAGNGDVLEIVVHKNVRQSEVIVSDILDSDRQQSFCTCWIMLEVGIFLTRLKNTQTGSGFKPGF
jgi:hypothetical protein